MENKGLTPEEVLAEMSYGRVEQCCLYCSSWKYGVCQIAQDILTAKGDAVYAGVVVPVNNCGICKHFKVREE